MEDRKSVRSHPERVVYCLVAGLMVARLHAQRVHPASYHGHLYHGLVELAPKAGHGHSNPLSVLYLSSGSAVSGGGNKPDLYFARPAGEPAAETGKQCKLDEEKKSKINSFVYQQSLQFVQGTLLGERDNVSGHYQDGRISFTYEPKSLHSGEASSLFLKNILDIKGRGNKSSNKRSSGHQPRIQQLLADKGYPPVSKRSFAAATFGGRDDLGLFLPTEFYTNLQKNTVQLSTGCTGTLLSPSFVLTAAHCVHNGHGLIQRSIKVDVPDVLSRRRIHYVRSVSIPKGWLQRNNVIDEMRSVYDYAILRLSFSANGRREYMKLRSPSVDAVRSNLYFMGFSLRGRPELQLHVCSWKGNAVYFSGNLLVSACRAGSGNSGASVFAWSRHQGLRILGIISHARVVNPNETMARSYRLTVITALTGSKVRHICDTISPEGQKYGVCPTPSLLPRLFAKGYTFDL